MNKQRRIAIAYDRSEESDQVLSLNSLQSINPPNLHLHLHLHLLLLFLPQSDSLLLQALLWCIKKFATCDDLLVLIHIIKLSEVDDEVQDASANASDACIPWKVEQGPRLQRVTRGAQDLHRGHEAAGR